MNFRGLDKDCSYFQQHVFFHMEFKMSFSSDELSTHLKAKGINTCPACNSTSGFQHLREITASVPYVDDQFHIDDTKAFPVVTVECVNCGYLLSFSAISSGVVK